MEHTNRIEDVLQAAEKEQLELALLVSKVDSSLVNSRYITGVDVSYEDVRAFTCAVVLDVESMEIVQKETKISICNTPYISGFFYLREAPLIIDILNDIKYEGSILIDGNGILHPRRMGLASYVGIKMNNPTVGVAKKLMLGEVGIRQGKKAPIMLNNEQLGMAFWAPKRRKPFYVSVGNRISLDSAADIIERVTLQGTPEPLRQAHLGSKTLRKASID